MASAAENDRHRAGRYLRQATGYRAFIPEPLPPDPPVDLTGLLREWLSEADYALGRLDGAILTLPNPDLFVFMYVRKEARAHYPDDQQAEPRHGAGGCARMGGYEGGSLC